MTYQEICDSIAGRKSFVLRIPANQQRERLDLYLAHHLPDASRQRLQQAIVFGAVMVNGQSVKRNYRIKPNDHIVLTVPWQPHPPLAPQPQRLTIIYEDQWLLVVNKAPGVVVHPAFQNWENTLLHGLLYYFQQQKIPHQPSLVHRLDKDTSGLLVVAKDPQTATLLGAQFAQRHPAKYYQALVWGCLRSLSGSIQTNIGEGGHPQKRQVYPYGGIQGQMAHTDYQVLKHWESVSHVEVHLHTGRTHQIRVHLAHVGHPVLGDRLYQFSQQDAVCWIERQALHANRLIFQHPYSLEPLTFIAPLPADMQHAIDQLEANSQTERPQKRTPWRFRRVEGTPKPHRKSDVQRVPGDTP